MKKAFLLLFIAIGLLSFKEDNKEKINEVQLEFLKESYNWSSEDLLIVNFRQPRKRCPYDNYKNLKKSSKWWTNFYSNMDLENTHNIFVYSDSEKAKDVIDSKKHFEDIYSFFLTKFFSKDQTCNGVLVINKNGEFRKIAGEYMQKDIENLIKQLL